MKHYDVIIIGGGPSGITCSYYLKKRGVSHIILEKGDMLHTWLHERWDSFYLVTPNWMTNLPDMADEIPYNNEYMSYKDILEVLRTYLEKVNPDYRDHCPVMGLNKVLDGYQVVTKDATYHASGVLVATGMYNTPFIPDLHSTCPQAVRQIHSAHYKNPNQLLKGDTLVVGSGWSGIQIALEIKRVLGLEVYLSVGSLAPLPTVYQNTNGVYWLNQLSGYSKGKTRLPYEAEDFENRNIIRKMNQNLNQCQREGVHLIGRLSSGDQETLYFDHDLHKTLDQADAYLEAAILKIDDLLSEGTHTPLSGDHDRYINHVDRSQLKDITWLRLGPGHIQNIVWSTGFKRSYDWINLPILGDDGMPHLKNGFVEQEALAFCGLGLSLDEKLKSSFGVGLYAIDESAERAVKGVLDQMNKK